MRLLKLFFLMICSFGFICVCGGDEAKITILGIDIKNPEQIIKNITPILLFKGMNAVEISSRKYKSQNEIHNTQIGLTLFQSSVSISQAYLAGGALSIAYAVGCSCYSLQSKIAERDESLNLEMFEKNNKITFDKDF